MNAQLFASVYKHHGNQALSRMGREMFRFKSELGFPPDMFLSELLKRKQLSLDQQVYILHVFMEHIIEHKRASAATDKAIERTRRTNRAAMERFIATGEVGIY